MVPSTLVDFHLHSSESDGYFAPEVLAWKLADAGIRYAALTDHHTTAGVARFREAAVRAGLAPIVGVELSAFLDDRELHLLAYRFDPDHPGLQAFLANPAPVEKAIQRLHQAGGTVFLAHPLDYATDDAALDALLSRLKEAGLDGVEAYYGAYSDPDRERLAKLAKRHGLLRAGGSDFHGPNLMGHPSPGVQMPTEEWKLFRNALGGSGAGGTPSRMLPENPSPAPPLHWRRFSFRIVFPALLAIACFLMFLFGVLIPTIESSLLARKREMIRELTNSAWSILAEYESEAQRGLITRDAAQANAMERIRFLRYGNEGKDYFWITDMTPRMIMHPYREDLNGQDLSDFTDPEGVRLFVEFVNEVRANTQGFVDYEWQWKDDPARLAHKESYVRGFEPWGWIIGTGIYIEDVEEDISKITDHVINFSALVFMAVGALLVFMAQQSWQFEKERGQAEAALRVSHEKYRALVEASSDGTLMVQNGRCAYANQPALDMLGYAEDELILMDLHDLFPKTDAGANQTVELLSALASGKRDAQAFESVIHTKSGQSLHVLLSPTRVSFGGQNGAIINIRDMAAHKALQDELGESRRKFHTLAEGIDVGVFRARLDSAITVIELNSTGHRILGIDEGGAPSFSLRELMADRVVCDQLFKTLQSEGAIKDSIQQVHRGDGRSVVISLSAVLMGGESGDALYCDGIIHDISERRRSESEREHLITQLQTSLLFLNEPVQNYAMEPVTCPMERSIRQVAQLMSRRQYSAAILTNTDGDPVGIVTDHDMRHRVVAPGFDFDAPVYEIMSAPVASISAWAPIYEAILLMREKQVRHLVVKNQQGGVVGLARNKELVRFDQYSPVVLTRAIQKAESFEEVIDSRQRQAVIIGALVQAGALPDNINRAVTAISDAIVEKTVGLTLQELGTPPLRFAFIAMGSEGREEQTLVTDQDNAIIYETPGPEGAEEAVRYFRRLGGIVCERLHVAGYPSCEWGMMASGAQWNDSLRQWQKKFTQWMKAPEPQELLTFNITFDFRCIVGDFDLVNQLRAHIHEMSIREAPFLLHMARNILNYKPPIGLFGKIVTGSGGAAPNAFNIKDAMAPIVNFARLYALQNHLNETNTTARLNGLRSIHILRDDNHRELIQAYHYLMSLRLQRQVGAIRDGRPPTNSINLDTLTHIEIGMLKQALSQINMIQKKVSFDFFGGA